MSEIATTSQPPAPSAQPIEVFAQHVRENPEALLRPADELAQEFALPLQFVQDFIAAMRTPVMEPSFLEVAARSLKEASAAALRTTRDTTLRFAAKPFPCLLGSTLVLGTVVILLILVAGAVGEDAQLVVSGAMGALVTAVFLAVTILQAVCFYVHGQMRHAMVFAIVVWCLVLAALSLLVSGDVSAQIAAEGIPPVAFSLVLTTALAGGYFLFASAFSLAGGYARFREETKRERTQSRQELLDRLFEIENRLQDLARDGRPTRKISLAERIRSSPAFVINCFAYGALFSSVTTGLLAVLHRLEPAAAQVGTTAAAFGVIRFSAGLLLFLSYAAAGFLAGRPGRAISAIVALWAGTLLPRLVPIEPFGLRHVLSELSLPNLVLGGLAAIALGVATGYAGLVENRNYRQKRLRENDAASLLAEKIQTEWRLRLGQSATAVLVVDVAGSTEMKADADPLKVEWSFREYQRMVEDISAAHGGEVLSTAGDGAVVGFASAEAALQAARRIQTEVPRFNARRNRLDRDFRLRIGVHVGETQSNLADAPFNEIIDIAAHVEAVAPVGGIAVSGKVAAELQDRLPLAEMARKVDNQSVWVVLNPTLGN